MVNSVMDLFHSKNGGIVQTGYLVDDNKIYSYQMPKLFFNLYSLPMHHELL